MVGHGGRRHSDRLAEDQKNNATGYRLDLLLITETLSLTDLACFSLRSLSCDLSSCAAFRDCGWKSFSLGLVFLEVVVDLISKRESAASSLLTVFATYAFARTVDFALAVELTMSTARGGKSMSGERGVRLRAAVSLRITFGSGPSRALYTVNPTSP